MTITIFGATGQVGLQVIHQALAKNYTVKAFGRNVESLIDKDLRDDKFIAIKGYVFDEKDVLKAIEGSDAVISCLGGGYDMVDKTRSLGIKNITTQMQKTSCKRVVAIGAVGILNAADDSLLMEAEDYPEAYKPVSLEHLSVLHLLEQSLLNYTFICPPNILNKPFEEGYLTNAIYLPTPFINVVNAGNIADCAIKSIEQNLYINQKVGICNKN